MANFIKLLHYNIIIFCEFVKNLQPRKIVKFEVRLTYNDYCHYYANCIFKLIAPVKAFKKLN